MEQHQEKCEDVGQDDRTNEQLEDGHGMPWAVSDMTDLIICPQRVRLRRNLHMKGERDEPAGVEETKLVEEGAHNAS